MSSEPHKERRVERRKLWGRAQGRPLSRHQSEMLDTLLPKIKAVPAPLLGSRIKNASRWKLVSAVGSIYCSERKKTPMKGLLVQNHF